MLEGKLKVLKTRMGLDVMRHNSLQYAEFCEALGGSPTHFRRALKLFDCLAVGVVVASGDGNLLYWNPTAIRLHGYQSEQQLQKPLEDFRHSFRFSRKGQVLPLEQWPMSRLLRGEAVTSEELEVQRIDTGQSWILSYSGEVLEADENDDERLFVLTIHDMTGERLAQSQAHRTAKLVAVERRRVERIGRVAPGAVHTYHQKATGEHCFTYTTPALEELYGVPAALLEQNADHAFQRMHPEDLSKIRSTIAVAAQNLEPWICEYRVLNPEKGEIWVQGRASPVPDGDGGLYWHGILVDITSLKQIEAALEAEKDRFQHIVDSVPGAIYSFCMRADGTSYFPYVSPVIEDIFGIDPALLLEDATPIFESVLPEYLPELFKSIEHSRETLEPWSAQIPFLHPKRGLAWTDGHSIPKRQSDGSTLWHGYLWDSTERRALERQFWQAQKMEAVGRLAGGVAHDFNNLLTVINSYTDMMILDTDEENPLRPGLLEIREAGRRSERLTSQLLAFSRHAVSERKVFDANICIQESQKMLQRLIGEDLELSVDLAPCPLPILLDQGQFEQLLLNLIVNARDAMPSGGLLTLSTAELDGEFVLSIRDSGCGISEEILSRIFEPFFTTKGVGKGTGLGLAVVHGVVTSGGGRIEVESEPGLGTLFRVFFPLVQAEPEQSSHQDDEPVRGKETILLVEDEPAVRRALSLGLQKYGYKVLVAESGQQAWEISDQFRETIHLMLSDVVMPGLCGPEVAQQLQQSRPGLKVLFMTGYTEDERIPLDSLRKPFTVSGALEKIREVLDNPA